MAAYNRKFDLDRVDLELIEASLHDRVRDLSARQLDRACLDRGRQIRRAKDLLGRLHNQKVFYRPKAGYIGG